MTEVKIGKSGEVGKEAEGLASKIRSAVSNYFAPKQKEDTTPIYVCSRPSKDNNAGQRQRLDIPLSNIGQTIDDCFIDDGFSNHDMFYFNQGETAQGVFGYSVKVKNKRMLVLSRVPLPLEPNLDEVSSELRQFYERFSDADSTLQPIPVTDQNPDYLDIVDSTNAEKSRLIRVERARERSTTRKYKRDLEQSSEQIKNLEKKLSDSSGEIDLLKKESLTDDLTGLENDRSYRKNRLRRIETVLREGTTMYLFAIDGKEFGRINKIYGDATGDEVLRALGQALSRAVRPTDHVYRKGGDEFKIIAYGKDDAPMIERIHEEVRKIKVANPLWQDKFAGDYFLPEDKYVGISVDVGIESIDGSLFQFRAKDLSKDEKIAIFETLEIHADAKMQELKKNSKNPYAESYNRTQRLLTELPLAAYLARKAPEGTSDAIDGRR